MNWNHAIDEAPRGKTVKTEQTRVRFDKTIEVVTEAFIPDYVWIATKCGKVIKSNWLPADGRFRPHGRWLGLGLTEQPIAWQHYVVPAHPASLMQETAQ